MTAFGQKETFEGLIHVPKVHSSGVTSYNHQVTRQEVHIAVQHFKATLSVYFVLKVFLASLAFSNWESKPCRWWFEDKIPSVWEPDGKTRRSWTSGLLTSRSYRLRWRHTLLIILFTSIIIFCFPYLWGWFCRSTYIFYIFDCLLDIYGIGCSCVSSLCWKLFVTKHKLNI